MEKILIIDDEKPTLAMFQLFLKAQGYQVITAESGQEGILLFEREKPPIVLTDIKMPGMDGLTILKNIKQISPDTEVIMTTGHGDAELAKQAMALDAADFLLKPIKREALDAALSKARRRIAGKNKR